MRFTTYTKYRGTFLDALNLEALMEMLADFLLQNGFDGGPGDQPWWAWDEPPSGDRSLDAVKEALLRALLQSGQLTPEMLDELRGEGQGTVDDAARAARSVAFYLSGMGLDFLGYRTLKDLLSALGRSSFGDYETPHLSTGIEAEAASRPYRFGDTLNLDIPATLKNAMRRSAVGVPLDLDYGDLMVHQSEYRSSCATVLMLDISHSMILYGEDRFTPAKKVALALAHLIRTRYPGDTLAVVTFGDRAEEIPLAEVGRDPALVRFVSKVSELARGRAYFTTTMTLGQYVMRGFLRRRTRRLG